ncbi:hypothetical protein MXD58_026355, partial [Frankia sp. AgKG'84/4]
VAEMGVDGFRFDLATALARNPDAFDADTYDSDDDYEANAYGGDEDTYDGDLDDRDLDSPGSQVDDEGDDRDPGDERVDPVASLDAEHDRADGDGPESRSVTARRRGLAR